MAKPEIRTLTVRELIVDPNVQRGLDRARAARIAEELDPNAIGVITVSRRINGSYHVVDGQHRVEAMRLAGGDDERVQCRIFTDLSPEQEARLFRLLNNTTKLQAVDRFRVRIVEGEPIAVAINDLLAKHGLKVEMGSGPQSFAAVAAAERIYNRDQAAVERAISTAIRAWGHDRDGADGRVFEGLGLVYARYGPAVDDGEMASKLAKVGTPASLLGKARTLSNLIRATVVACVAEITVDTYNASRRTRALPPWRA